MSEKKDTGSVVPPLIVFSNAVKSKVAVPFPLSQSEAEAVFAVGSSPTVRLTGTGTETQFPIETVA